MKKSFKYVFGDSTKKVFGMLLKNYLIGSVHLCIWASVHMHMLAGSGIISHRSNLHIFSHTEYDLKITETINTLLT